MLTCGLALQDNMDSVGGESFQPHFDISQPTRFDL
jgi:hypothetical protein